MKKKWQKRLMSLVIKLGFGDKMKAGSLTADEQKQLFTEYESTYGLTFAADKEADEDDDEESTNVLSAEEQIQLASIFGEDNAPKTPKEAVPALTNKVTEQQKTIETLEKQPEDNKPVETVKVEKSSPQVIATTLGLSPHSTTYLFGIESPNFARSKWYNNLMVARKAHESEADISPEQSVEFKEAVTALSSELRKRIDYLDSNNMLDLLDFEKLVSGQGSIDYSDLFGQAGEYIVRRTDIILAYLRSLPSVDHILRMVSNVQNKEIVPGAHFGELSQGYRKGKIYKGRANFTAEIYAVNDLMFKFLFEDLIDLEKQYIGYLNREGSSVIKWTFIEWIMVHFGKILHNERNQRRIIGVRVPQQNVKDNPAMFGADGMLRAVERVEEQYKVLPFLDMKAYDNSTLLDYFEEIYDRVEQILPSMEGMAFYANAKHKRAYTRLFRAKYGKDNDFTGVKEGLIDISPEKIIWIPNMRNTDYKVIITFPGNMESYEDKPNEMVMFYFERDWESLGVMSRWKEGAGLRQAGVKYKDLESLKKSNFKHQYVFTNFPATDLDPDAGKIDGSRNTIFLTGENTVATVISDIENSDIDCVYKIVCGSLTNATKINKTGKFAKIQSQFVPNKVGDYIKVYAELEDYQETTEDGETYTATRPTGNFLELERKVSA
ncbi:MAG: hypothetical protein E6767_19250 [Dysgonomonas sp.]|nr:hypothetical protein [Dysgonomonas sp.]